VNLIRAVNMKYIKV